MILINVFIFDIVQVLLLYVMNCEQFVVWWGQQFLVLVVWFDVQYFNGSGGSVVLLFGEYGFVGVIIGVGDVGDVYVYVYVFFVLFEGSVW